MKESIHGKKAKQAITDMHSIFVSNPNLDSSRLQKCKQLISGIN